MENHHATPFPGLSPLSVAIIVVASAAAVLLIYHIMVVRCCNARETTLVTQHQQLTPQHSAMTVANFEDLENSITELIPTYKFTKDIGLLVSKSDDVDDLTCAVCLSEFKDGEAIRVLPECLHSFHVPCIDMWLYSHPNCPLCRADTPVHDHMVAGFRSPLRSDMIIR